MDGAGEQLRRPYVLDGTIRTDDEDINIHFLGSCPSQTN